MAYKASPRPTFDRPTAIRYDDVVRHTWGDDEAGHVDDWIYVSSGLVHALVFGLPPGGAFRHSPEFRTIFGADEVLHVLQGVFVAANPETGEVHRLVPGESLFFRRDTWHHGFSHGSEDLRVLEFFAPPPSTGTSGPYARTKPYLETSRYTDDTLLGRLPGAARKRETMRVLGPGDASWRLEGSALVGLLVSTEHLTVGTLSLPAGQSSSEARHGGDELLYVMRGRLAVEGEREGEPFSCEAGARDAVYLPEGASHRATALGSEPAEAIFGVAPSYAPPG